MGPSPWAFKDRSIMASGVTYHFHETAPGDGKLAGMTSLQDSGGATLLLLDFQCYTRILDDGTVLVWRESGGKAERRIMFDRISLSVLERVSDTLAAACEIREKKLGINPILTTQHWEFSPYLQAGTHPLSVPHDWSRFEEILVLADWPTTRSGRFAWRLARLRCVHYCVVRAHGWSHHQHHGLALLWVSTAETC